MFVRGSGSVKPGRNITAQIEPRNTNPANQRQFWLGTGSGEWGMGKEERRKGRGDKGVIVNVILTRHVREFRGGASERAGEGGVYLFRC